MNQPNIDIYPLLREIESSKGATGPTGATGKRGLQGPAGSGSLLTFEYLTYTGTPLDISTTLNVTYITNTSYTDAEFNLANAIEGFVKYISLTQPYVYPVQINTTLETFNLSPANPQIQLVFVNDEFGYRRL